MLSLSRREATLAALGAVALAVPTAARAAEDPKDKDLQALRTLLQAHNAAMTAQDMEGLMATLSPKCVVMGTAPGELWIGHEEIADAYRHFFEDFDKGKQSFEDLWHDGNIGPAGAWLMVMSKVTLHKGSEKNEFGLNMSMTCEKHDGKWLIRAMHFSNLAGPAQG